MTSGREGVYPNVFGAKGAIAFDENASFSSFIKTKKMFKDMLSPLTMFQNLDNFEEHRNQARCRVGFLNMKISENSLKRGRRRFHI